MLKIGSHVGMSGKEMMLGSVKEALSYKANTFMLYTGAPQNTKRKGVDELNIEAAHKLMKENDISDFIVHAPYIINLGNTVKKETFEIAVDFLRIELDRTEKMGSKILVLHPGAHVGAGVEAGIAQIANGLNQVLTPDTNVYIALETMAGKGTEIGRSFEELAMIYDKVIYKDKLRVCFDTCHVNDAGYDLINDYEGVMKKFDEVLGLDQIVAFHINDSKNPIGANKDRHENFGFGHVGFDTLMKVIYDERFENIPKILETPYIPSNSKEKTVYAPYKYEIEMIRNKVFQEGLREDIINNNER